MKRHGSGNSGTPRGGRFYQECCSKRAASAHPKSRARSSNVMHDQDGGSLQLQPSRFLEYFPPPLGTHVTFPPQLYLHTMGGGQWSNARLTIRNIDGSRGGVTLVRMHRRDCLCCSSRAYCPIRPVVLQARTYKDERENLKNMTRNRSGQKNTAS